MTPERQFTIATMMGDFDKASPAQKMALYRSAITHAFDLYDQRQRFAMDYARRRLPMPILDNDALAPLDPRHFNEEAE